MKKDKQASAEHITFRLKPGYAEKVVKAAQDVGVNPNQFGRMATMAMAQNRIFELVTEVGELAAEVKGLRSDFDDAVQRDEE